MFPETILDQSPVWLLYAGTVLLLFAGNEVGFPPRLAAPDVQMKRVRAAEWNRIPQTIVLTLYGMAFLALTAMGYGAGLAESRTTLPSVMLILTFSAIIVLIVDLERPRQQFFEVSQQPMADVARRIQSFQP